ncbi:hypothetical protein [Gordonia sp. NPDC058843]|uniref:hypothetical protein n=1 Tax=Gordonia sp. NPDC058843 TaxID=3346648 RepID=UPI0036C9A288
MLDINDLALHGLTLRQLATIEQLADVTGLDSEAIGTALDQAVADGRAIAARGAYMITPAGREHLDAVYPGAFAALRSDAQLVSTLADFEHGINKKNLALMTSWQTIVIDGTEQPNDHSDSDHDAKVIDRLAQLHDRATVLLAPFADADALCKRFLARLDDALQKVDHGEHDYVSSVRIDSYHTVWYQMHEHLLRVMGEERDE